MSRRKRSRIAARSSRPRFRALLTIWPAATEAAWKTGAGARLTRRYSAISCWAVFLIVNTVGGYPYRDGRRRLHRQSRAAQRRRCGGTLRQQPRLRLSRGVRLVRSLELRILGRHRQQRTLPVLAVRQHNAPMAGRRVHADSPKPRRSIAGRGWRAGPPARTLVPRAPPPDRPGREGNFVEQGTMSAFAGRSATGPMP